MMNSQMIIGGSHKMEDTPQFRSALEKRQLQLMKEFDQKLKDFVPDNEGIDTDKAQVEKYKSVMLKQRDIMVALTTKLNQRDESIVHLQDKLEEYEKIYKDQEDSIKVLKECLNNYENMLKNNGISIPKILSDNKEKINVILSENSNIFNNISSARSNSQGKGIGNSKQIYNSSDKIYFPYHVERNEEGNK